MSAQAIRDALAQPPFPPELMVDFSQATRFLAEGPAANESKDDPVIFDAALEVQLRQMIAKFGFARLPLTYGELRALVDYCQDLHMVRHEDLGWSPSSQKMFQDADLSVARRYRPWSVVPLELAIAADWEGLRKHHEEHDMLTFLGTTWLEFEDEEDEEPVPK